MPIEWELVLDLAEDEGPDVCYYYFVNRSNRTLFWLHQFDMTPLLHNLPPVKPKSNRRIRELKFPTPLVVLVSNLQPQNKHWRVITGKFPPEASILCRFTGIRNHWEMFPHNREVSKELLQELMGIMIHAGLGE